MAVEYLDTSLEEVRHQHAGVVDDIGARGLVYPVTIVDGRMCCDGAVSYPAVMRAVESILSERARA